MSEVLLLGLFMTAALIGAGLDWLMDRVLHLLRRRVK